MAVLWQFLATLLVIHSATCLPSTYSTYEERVAKFITQAEAELWKLTQKHTVVEWAYASNITDHNEKEKLEFQASLWRISNN